MSEYQDFLNLCDNDKIRYFFKNNMLFINAKDLGSTLKIKNIRSSIQYFTKEEKELINCDTDGGKQNMNYITIAGVKKLICTTRSHLTRSYAITLNIQPIDTYKISIEANLIEFLSQIFQGLNFVTQFRCHIYKIDLYFIDFKLAIECDEEKKHKYQYSKDIKRQKFLEEKLNCKFVRFRPESKNFKIAELINQCILIILDYKKNNDIISNMNNVKIN